jgi:CarD family transcriptional regulator
LRLLVGDAVVYAPHGVGRIIAREERTVLGTTQEILVLALGDGLAVTLTVAHARDVVRPPIEESDLVRVEQTLREERALADDPWLKRRRETSDKLAGGDPLSLAEVIRDGAGRQESLKLKKGQSQLAGGEKDAYLRARKILAAEIALVRGVEVDDADAWIEEQLAASVLSARPIDLHQPD